MQPNSEQFKEVYAEIADLQYAMAVLRWDQSTYMPEKAAQDRGMQLATLARLVHQKVTSPEYGKLLEALASEVADLDADSDQVGMVREARRTYDKQTRVPAEWVGAFAKVTALARQAWEQARSQKNFSLFQPHLEKIVEMRQEYAQYFAPYDHIYDTHLDNYEPGMKTREVQAIFDVVRPEQVKLVEAIAARPPVDDSFLHQPFPEKDQWAFGMEVIAKFGYDLTHGRQDTTAHPFTTGFGLGDVRITTRLLPNFLSAGLFGTMHECGHALHGLGNNPAFRRTPLLGSASNGISESQSRLYENLVGRSYSFWHYFYPRLQAVFPVQLGNISLDRFYQGINKVQPSLIRIQADEATYNLHIMLRLNLEIALLEGSVLVRDLPDAWNQRMKEYLGVTPANNAEGVLQDIHWSGGMIGYFPSYALGNMISAQLWERMKKDLPDISDQVSQGEFARLLAWLRENVHRYGKRFAPQQLLEKVTGSKLDPAPYLRYLNRKFGEIYGL